MKDRSVQDERLVALGRRIVTFRGHRSQREIAREAGIDVATVSRIERGIYNPSLLTLEGIAKALDVSSVDLINGTQKATPPVNDPNRLGSIEERVSRIEESVAELEDKHVPVAIRTAQEALARVVLLEEARATRRKRTVGE